MFPITPRNPMKKITMKKMKFLTKLFPGTPGVLETSDD